MLHNLPTYYTDKTQKRLNSLGRSLFATKYRLLGMTDDDVALALNIPTERLHKLYGNAVGILGYFDEYPVGTQAEEIIEFNSCDIAVRIDILIAKKGDKLFTNEPLPVDKRKKK